MAKKELGSKALAQNDFLEPKPPVSVIATDVGTNRPYNNGAASVSFSLPAGSPAATSYTVTSSPGSLTASGSSSPITITGLSSSTNYTFTVTATNASGTSAPSSPSSSIPITTVPQAPQSPSVNAQSANVNRIIWTTPANGGKTLGNYSITGSDGTSYNNIAGTVSGSQTYYDATDNTPSASSPGSQTYTITATNANGSSLTATTGSVNTTPPFFPPSFPFFPFFPPFFPPSFCPFFPFFPPFFPPNFCPFFPPNFCPFFPPSFCPWFPYFSGGGSV